MKCEANWITSIGPFITPIVVAIVGACFAYQQAVTARRKLRLDLFDKRFKVLDATRTFLGQVIAHGKVEVRDIQAFMIGTLDAQFLLNDELSRYLEEINKRAAAMMAIKGNLEGMEVGDKRTRTVEMMHKEFGWLVEQITVLPTKFGPFLKVEG